MSNGGRILSGCQVSSGTVKQVLNSSILVAVTDLQGFNALVKGADIESLWHVDGSSEYFLHIKVVVKWLTWYEHDFDLNEELLAEGVALGTVEAEVDLADFVASSDALTLERLELLSDLDRDF